MPKFQPFSVVTTVEGDGHRLVFKGSITEEAKPALMTLVNGPEGKVLLDFGDVQFVNSCGVRDWSVFLKVFQQNRTIAFDRVTDEVVRTMNMVLSFHARLPVKSVFRTYACESCGAELNLHLLEGKDYTVGKLPRVPAQACEKCGGESTPIESDDEFFQFLVA